MAAYRNCKFCHGRGCVACEGERERAFERVSEPIFIARNDADIELLKRAIGREAIEYAYSPRGGGEDELRLNILWAAIQQAKREQVEREARNEEQPPQGQG